MNAAPKSKQPDEKSQEAVTNPASVFEHPLDIVDTPTLSEADKRKALDEWETDERALQRATEEGMAGGTPPRLAEVKHAKRHAS
jgi:hypothetical protein